MYVVVYTYLWEKEGENNTVDKFYEKEQSVRLNDIDTNNNKYRIVINKRKIDVELLRVDYETSSRHLFSNTKIVNFF